jgi:hypothetical protein
MTAPKSYIPEELHLFTLQDACLKKCVDQLWENMVSKIKQTNGVHTEIHVPLVDENGNDLSISKKLELQTTIEEQRKTGTGYQFVVRKVSETGDNFVCYPHHWDEGDLPLDYNRFSKPDSEIYKEIAFKKEKPKPLSLMEKCRNFLL